MEKLQTAIAMLDEVRRGTRFERAWEIGCAEGAMTVRLAPICGRLSAVDFIPLALQRASTRSQEFSNISFIEWDLKADPPPGTVDLDFFSTSLAACEGDTPSQRRAWRRAVYEVIQTMTSAMPQGQVTI
jgi:Nodulation protein S (NodS)